MLDSLMARGIFQGVSLRQRESPTLSWSRSCSISALAHRSYRRLRSGLSMSQCRPWLMLARLPRVVVSVAQRRRPEHALPLLSRRVIAVSCLFSFPVADLVVSINLPVIMDCETHQQHLASRAMRTGVVPYTHALATSAGFRSPFQHISQGEYRWSDVLFSLVSRWPMLAGNLVVDLHFRV
jgi:hypothetical protein